jgi:putative alpha-1,2-mannosidase
MLKPTPFRLTAWSVLLSTAVLLRAVSLDEVDPFIGTGKAGNCYPGAQAPFGMISWSPNTTFEDYESVPSRPSRISPVSAATPRRICPSCRCGARLMSLP